MLSCLLRHRLRNNTKRTLYLRELLNYGTCIHETRLDPGMTRDDFPATTYRAHNRLFGRPSMIVIFVGNYQAFGGLIPQDFITYFELIFEVDEGNDTLIVSGIPAQPTDYFPLRYISLVKTLKDLRWQERTSYFWNYFTKREFGRDYGGRPRDIIMINGYKVAEAKNKGNLLSGQEMMTINVMINYDGEQKKTKEGGFIWSSGAHAKWKAISVDKNNLTLDGVAHQICATLGLNRSEIKLMFCHLPDSHISPPGYIEDSRTLNIYLTLNPHFFRTIPQLHVKIVKNNDD